MSLFSVFYLTKESQHQYSKYLMVKSIGFVAKFLRDRRNKRKKCTVICFSILMRLLDVKWHWLDNKYILHYLRKISDGFTLTHTLCYFLIVK